MIGSSVAWGLAAERDADAGVYDSRLRAKGSLTTDENAAYLSLQSQRDDLVRAGAAIVSVGAAVAGLGVVLWLVDRPEAPSTTIAPVVGPGAAGLSLRGSF
jgi:hypothetical protein